MRGGSVPRRTRRVLVDPPGTGASRDTAHVCSAHAWRCRVRSQRDAGECLHAGADEACGAAREPGCKLAA